MKCVITLLLLFFSIEVTICTVRDDIVSEARSLIGDTTWSYRSDHGTGENTNKCNQFVYDVLDAAGADPPRRHPWLVWLYRPIGAGEWGNRNSRYLREKRCWNICSGQHRPGDVISDSSHVGIVTGHRLTTSASSSAHMVVENDWGYRSSGSGSTDSITACWRYYC